MFKISHPFNFNFELNSLCKFDVFFANDIINKSLSFNILLRIKYMQKNTCYLLNIHNLFNSLLTDVYKCKRLLKKIKLFCKVY